MEPVLGQRTPCCESRVNTKREVLNRVCMNSTVNTAVVGRMMEEHCEWYGSAFKTHNFACTLQGGKQSWVELASEATWEFPRVCLQQLHVKNCYAHCTAIECTNPHQQHTIIHKYSSNTEFASASIVSAWNTPIYEVPDSQRRLQWKNAKLSHRHETSIFTFSRQLGASKI